MELQVITAAGNAAKQGMSVSDETFACEYKEGLIHQVVTSYLAGARQGSRAQKNRSAVSGGGAKPWRQKGTGRARAGTSRSPIWRKGGVTFAAQPQDHSKKVNRKMYRVAMRSIVSELARQERLVVVDKLELEAAKTKMMAEKLKKMGLEDVLVVTDELTETLFLAARNLKNVMVMDAETVDPVALMMYQKVLMTKAAVKQLEERLS